jgi:hypothetical protein
MLHKICSDDASSQMTMNGTKRFKNGSTLLDKDDWSGRPSTSGSKPLISQVKNIPGNHRPTVQEVAKEVGIFVCSSHTMLMEDREGVGAQKNLCQDF